MNNAARCQFCGTTYLVRSGCAYCNPPKKKKEVQEDKEEFSNQKTEPAHEAAPVSEQLKLSL